MKIKTTNKELKQRFGRRIGISYCAAQHLLNGKNPLFYTCGTYGWNTDIYYIDDNTIIQTGYRSFCDNISPAYDLVKAYDKKALDIIYDYTTPYEMRQAALEYLLKEFVEKVTAQ